jgi:hypothetical protein
MAKPSPTPRFRFSLLALFGFVTFAAIACAMLVAKPLVWSLRVLVFTLLAWGGIAAVYGKNTSRAFWFGFIATGWGYMAFEHFIGAPGRLPANLAIDMLVRMGFGSGGMLIDGEVIEQIAYLVCTTMLGIIGGLLARHLCLRREREKTLPKI